MLTAALLQASAYAPARSRIVPAATAMPLVFTGIVNLLAQSRQTCLNPPSAVMVDPVVKLDRSLAKNTAAFAISTGSAKRPSGMVDTRAARNSSIEELGSVCAARLSLPGVAVDPATRTLTRMLRSATSLAQARANERTAALDAA